MVSSCFLLVNNQDQFYSRFRFDLVRIPSHHNLAILLTECVQYTYLPNLDNAPYVALWLEFQAYIEAAHEPDKNPFHHITLQQVRCKMEKD